MEETKPQASDDSKTWIAYWTSHGQAWRTEPEITSDRQAYLAEQRAIMPDVERGLYPFKGIEPPLSRADLEWLLATHSCDNHEGPIDPTNQQQAHLPGLDLRGARLSSLPLGGLPLANICGGLHPNLLAELDAGRQSDALEAAAIHLEGSNLTETHLERAVLSGAHLEGATCVATHLDGAYLLQAHLQRAHLVGATCRGTILIEADLSRVFARFARFEGAVLSSARLTRAELSAARFDAAQLQEAHLDHARLFQATLAGADLSQAHLEGTKLNGANLGGRLISQDEVDALRLWWPNIQRELHGANLQGCFFSGTTDLTSTLLGTKKVGCVTLANVHFDGVNLGVVDWSDVTELGDEREARVSNKKGSFTKAGIQLFHLQSAARAYRQLSVALSAQGLTEEANRYGYLAQVLAGQVLWRKLCLSGHGLPQLSLRQRWNILVAHTFSLFLDALAGYGYKPQRSLYCYALVIGAFALTYHAIGMTVGPHLSFFSSLVFSVTSFHGRGFFPGGISLDDPMTVTAAFEAILGLLIEISFIATFTQRFFAR